MSKAKGARAERKAIRILEAAGYLLLKTDREAEGDGGSGCGD